VRSEAGRIAGPALFPNRDATRLAMKAASSLTNPISADPRVCC
jgi:hypothetical protein